MKYDQLIDELKKEFPKFKLVKKSESAFMKVLDVLLKLITFWRFSNFMTGAATTVGFTVYVPTGWTALSPVSRMITLRHERVHMRQRTRFGALMFVAYYFLLFFPTVLAYGRMKLEREAYEETMRAIVELIPGTGWITLTTDTFRDRMVGHFTGPMYFWMWPWKKSVMKWYDDFVVQFVPKE